MDLPGWSQDTSGVASVDALQAEARDYVRRIEELVGVRVRYVGTGPHRDQLLDGVAAAD
jgi:adenylosuccinate synthase